MKKPAIGLLIASFALTTAQSSRAADLLGLYVGGSVGRADVKTTLEPLPQLYQFDVSDTAWKALVGLQPIPLIAVELAYVDFGHPSSTNVSVAATKSASGRERRFGANRFEAGWRIIRRGRLTARSVRAGQQRPTQLGGTSGRILAAWSFQGGT